MSDPKSRALLEDANRKDIELYNYARDVIYPKQTADYGPSLDKDVAAFEAVLKRGKPPGREPIRSALMRRYVHQPVVRTWYRWKA